MFFDKKIWDDFEKEIEKWEREEEEKSYTTKLVIEKSSSDRLKIAARIIATVIEDEAVTTGDNKCKITDMILNFLSSDVRKLVDKY